MCHALMEFPPKSFEGHFGGPNPLRSAQAHPLFQKLSVHVANVVVLHDGGVALFLTMTPERLLLQFQLDGHMEL